MLGCASSEPAPGDLLPAFALRDVNPTSATFDEVVSTDTHAARTAWYFGHAT